jgi:hypothetical protein
MKEIDMDAPERQKDREVVKQKMERLQIDFRKMPMYQFFREIGPLEGFAVIEHQMGLVNSELKIIGVFLFEDEAQRAKEYLESKRKPDQRRDWIIKPTKITRYQGF